MQPVRKHLLKEYFTFPARERRAVLVLLALVVLFALLPRLFPFLVKEPPPPFSPPEAVALRHTAPEAGSTASRLERDGQPVTNRTSRSPAGDWFKGELFYFNPNTATEADWKRLGVREKTVQSILNYRSKGGVFRRPEDLGKIYTLHPKVYEKLLPWVRIPAEPAAQKTVPPATQQPEKTENTSRPSRLLINQADAVAWQRLPGIGPAFAHRILRFREKLGGFVSVNQVAETYGLPDTTFNQIRELLVADDSNIRRINLNTATWEELKAHPYIDSRTARTILAYREQHGPFASVETLRRIGSMDDELYQRIAPYLSVE